ncbi:MAG: DUF3307 domain-containing protein [candidate division WOR-3 bacterium]|nr:DUF3307 domain-containing protein [candidate division WOR-3 bacterium]
MNEFLSNNLMFTILLSGHLAGDFLFQTDLIYRLKKTSFYGQLIHAFINAALISILLIILYRDISLMLISMVIVFTTHLIIDYSKVKLPFKNPFIFIIDQLLHIGILLILAIIMNEGYSSVFITGNNLKIPVLINTILIAALFLKYLNGSIRKYMGKEKEKGFLKENAGALERIIILFFAYMHGFFFIMIPLIIIPRIVYGIHRGDEYIFYDTLFSMITASLAGILLRQFTVNSPISPIIFMSAMLIFIALHITVSILSDIIERAFY